MSGQSEQLQTVPIRDGQDEREGESLSLSEECLICYCLQLCSEHTNSVMSREEDLVKAQRACLTRLPGYICRRQSSSWESSL